MYKVKCNSSTHPECGYCGARNPHSIEVCEPCPWYDQECEPVETEKCMHCACIFEIKNGSRECPQCGFDPNYDGSQ